MGSRLRFCDSLDYFEREIPIFGGIFIIGFQAQSFIIIGDSAVIVALLVISATASVIGVRIRSEPDGLIVIGNGAVILAFAGIGVAAFVIGDAAIVVGPGEVLTAPLA